MANRRKNTRAPRKARTRKEVAAAARSRSKNREQAEGRELDEEWETLHAKIGVLENFITGSVMREQKRARLKSQNILPPPEHRTQPNRRRQSQKMGRWEAQNYYGQREKHGLMFLLLFAAVCAMLWWLINGAGLPQ